MQGENKPGVVSFTATRWGQLLNSRKLPPGELPPSATDCYRFVLSNPAVDLWLCGPKNTEQMREALREVESSSAINIPMALYILVLKVRLNQFIQYLQLFIKL